MKQYYSIYLSAPRNKPRPPVTRARQQEVRRRGEKSTIRVRSKSEQRHSPGTQKTCRSSPRRVMTSELQSLHRPLVLRRVPALPKKPERGFYRCADSSRNSKYLSLTAEAVSHNLSPCDLMREKKRDYAGAQ